MAFDGTNVGKKSKAFEDQTTWLHVTRSLLGGTKIMREAGEKYLPRKRGEDKESYENRLNGAVLVNHYARTGGYLAGQVFQKPVSYQKPEDGRGAPEDQEEYWKVFAENVDAQGANLSMFTARVFRAGVDDGVTFLLADYSRVNVEQDGAGYTYLREEDGTTRPKTAATDEERNLRPYWVPITADNVLDCVLEVVSGVPVVRSFRYLEQITERDEKGGEVLINRVRVFSATDWELWEQIEGRGDYVRRGGGPLKDERGRTLGVVPVVWFIPGRPVTPVTARPVMEDLAWMNVSHWQAYSNHIQLMNWVRSPAWFGKKLLTSSGDTPVMSPGHLISVDDDSASLESVGVDSGSVNWSLSDLKDKTEYMSLYGLQMITSTATNITATQAEFIAGSSESQLKEWVQALQDTMENALKLIARWKGFADGPALSINTEFRLALNVQLLTFLSSLCDKGQLSTQTLLETLKLMGVFADEFTVKDELEKLKKQANDNQFTPGWGDLAGGGRYSQEV